MDITTTTYYKKPDIMVTSMDDAFAQDKVNSAFRSLYDQMTTYQPDTTANEFADFCWRGNIKNKYQGKVKPPAREVPLVGMTSNGATLNVGYITINGDVVFYDIDVVKNSCLCYDIVWQKVDANIFQAADYGSATFQIGGNGPTLQCNCLFKPCVWDGLCSTVLPQTQYCYNYVYYYDGNLFYSNDGRYPNNIIGWTCVGGTAQFITTDNYDVTKVSCTCCECTMYANETCVGPDGTRWTINNTICQWCVYETWEIVPTGTAGGVYCVDPDTGRLLARPALWSWNGTNNYSPMRVSSFCNGINACRGFNVGAKSESGIGYIEWAGCCHDCDHLVVDFSTQVMDRNWKAGRIQEIGECKLNWNPNNEYWDHCLGFYWDARYPLNNIFDTNKQYWKSPSRTFKDCFAGLDFDEGWGTIPYSREVYDEMFRCWKECGCINTYNMWLGGNYINYALCWCCHVVSNTRCLYSIDDYHDSWSVKACLTTLEGWWCGELHPTRYTSLYYRDFAGGSINPAWVPPAWIQNQPSLNCTWSIVSIPVDCYTSCGWAYPIQVRGDYCRCCWEPQMMYGIDWEMGDNGDPWNCCKPGFNSVSSNMMFANINTEPWCECFRNGTIDNYNPWYGFRYNDWGERSCLYIPEVWWNEWTNWQYAPYSYCRLTTHYCVHREMQGVNNELDLGEISIRVRYKTGSTK